MGFGDLTDGLREHRRVVATGLLAVENALQRLVASLAHQPNWIAVQDAASSSEAARLAGEAYCAIDYGMEDDVDSSVVCLGVIGASTDILERAAAVNEAKAEFKKICAPLQKTKVRVPVKGAAGTKAIPLIRLILRNIQRSDLNLLAAYRKIPILPAPPAVVTYTQAHTRSVYRKTVADIENMLLGRDGPHEDADRNKLLNLPPNVTHLALVRSRYANIRANVRFTRLDTRGRGRCQISAELPLMYAIKRSKEPPEVKFPVVDTSSSAAPARDRTQSVEPHPFLHTLPVHRYLPEA